MRDVNLQKGKTSQKSTEIINSHFMYHLQIIYDRQASHSLVSSSVSRSTNHILPKATHPPVSAMYIPSLRGRLYHELREHLGRYKLSLSFFPACLSYYLGHPACAEYAESTQQSPMKMELKSSPKSLGREHLFW